MPKFGDIRIGVSGWRYKPWRGIFYPENLAQKRELAFAADNFRSIEINGTFYSLRTPTSFERWVAETPANFVFAVKDPRYITHILRLKNVESALANFLASGVMRLGKKLGPILWQLPPNFSFDPQRLEPFFKLLPRDTEEAAAIARRHEKWLTKSEPTRNLCRAISRSGEPEAIPREISSRSAKVSESRERPRIAGGISPLGNNNLRIVGWGLPKARPIACMDCPHFHRRRCPAFPREKASIASVGS